MGVKNGHTVHIVPKYTKHEIRQSIQKNKKKKDKQKRKCGKKKIKGSAKTLATNLPSSDKSKTVDYSTNVNNDRVEHSKRLSAIFEEASDIFKEHRQRLNELSIQKCTPKSKSSFKPATNLRKSEVAFDSSSLGSKAGKSFFPVLVGHEEYLYKTSKASKHATMKPHSLDLHGCTREQALLRLTSSLPSWLDEAMKEHPYTLAVNIISGGGCQIVADAVEHWIRENRNVANRF